MSKDPERRDKAVIDSLESMSNILKATYENMDDVPDDIKAIMKALEEGSTTIWTE